MRQGWVVSVCTGVFVRTSLLCLCVMLMAVRNGKISNQGHNHKLQMALRGEYASSQKGAVSTWQSLC